MNRHHLHTIRRMKSLIPELQAKCTEVGDTVDLDMDLESLEGVERFMLSRNHHLTTIGRMKFFILKLQEECNEVGDIVDLDVDLESLKEIERRLKQWD